MRLIVLARDVVYVVCSASTGVPLAMFATEEAANADAALVRVRDSRCVVPWVLRAATVVEVPS